jgi:hypothetical protein
MFSKFLETYEDCERWTGKEFQFHSTGEPNSIEQSPSSVADSRSATQYIPRPVRSPKVHYHFHKSPSLYSCASLIQSTKARPVSFRSILILFSNVCLYSRVLSPLHVFHVMLFALVVLMISCEWYKMSAISQDNATRRVNLISLFITAEQQTSRISVK